MHRSSKILVFVAALLLLAGLTGIVPAHAQTATKLIVSAKAGYGDTGAYMLGDWMPVRITLANPAGGDSRHVTVRVDSGSSAQNNLGHYQQDVDLPAQSRKEITLYTYSSNYGHQFSVQLFENGAEIETEVVSAAPLEPPTSMIIAVASSDSSLMNPLASEQVGHAVAPPGSANGYYYGAGTNTTTSASATVAHIALADIPVLSEALDSVGALVLDDVDSTSLSAEQLSSIEGWIARGGMLILTYRPGGADTIAGFDKLVPVAVSGSQNVSSLSSLSSLVSSEIPISGSVNIGNAQMKTDELYTSSTRVLATQQGTPLVAVRDVGQGHVLYMGISPDLAPLKTWDGLIPLEKLILSEHQLRLSYGETIRFSAYSQNYGYYNSSLFSAGQGMFELPGLQLPNAWLIAGFLLLYIILIGPVNFFILRRIRRTELAWFTIPVFIVLFSVFAYLLAYSSKGGDLVTINVNVVNTAEGVDVATMHQHIGIFSPLRSTYRVTLDASSSVTELNPYGFYQSTNSNPAPVNVSGNTTTIDNVNIDTWGLRAFLAEHTSPATSPLQADLHLGNNKITGKVKNNTTGPLQDVALLRGNSVQYVGYMAPGDEADVSLGVESTVFNSTQVERVLPLPVGVVNPQNGYTYYGGSGPSNSAEQREYDRKLNALSAALFPLISGDPPTDLNVIMLAWGPAPSTQFGIDGRTSQVLEDNVWASTVHVSTTQSDQSSLDSSLVPYTIYAPGNNPSLLIVGAASNQNGNPSANTMVIYSQFGGQTTFSQSIPQPVPTDTPDPSITVIPPPVPTYTVGAVVSAINVTPYIDFRYRLPAGVQPQSLNLDYRIDQKTSSKTLPQLDILAYNVKTGAWDKIATMGGSTLTLSQAIPNPTQYVGPAGDVTVRMSTADGSTTTINGFFQMGLNSTK